jgi:Tol biopolymer transport system component
MKASHFFLGLLCLFSATHTFAEDSDTKPVTSHDGKIIYYIVALDGVDDNGFQNNAIAARDKATSKKSILLSSHSANNSEGYLGGVENLNISPDDNTLFFEMPAGTSSNEIYSIDLKTKKLTDVVSGEVICIVQGGKNKGNLIVEEHKYFVQGGSYNSVFLLSPKGKQLGVIALEDDDPSIQGACKSTDMTLNNN